MGPRVTAILNLKGGVGKTTTVISMAAALATVHKKTVLVIDADSQCNTTEFFDAFSDNHKACHDCHDGHGLKRKKTLTVIFDDNGDPVAIEPAHERDRL